MCIRDRYLHVDHQKFRPYRQLPPFALSAGLRSQLSGFAHTPVLRTIFVGTAETFATLWTDLGPRSNRPRVLILYMSVIVKIILPQRNDFYQGRTHNSYGMYIDVWTPITDVLLLVRDINRIC